MTRQPGVCFDATGTLIEVAQPVGEVYRRVALEFGVDLPAWRLDDAFRRVLRHAPERGREGRSETERRAAEFDWWAERIRQTFQATDSTVRFADPAAFARALFEAYQAPDAWRPRAGIPALLARLRRAGVPMGVVSNFDYRLPKILQTLELASFFITIEIPSKQGRAKPEAAVFEAVASALERPLDALVYVGDDPPELMDEIRRHGLRVVPVSPDTNWSDESDAWLEVGSGDGTATLPARDGPGPASRSAAASSQKGSGSR